MAAAVPPPIARKHTISTIPMGPFFFFFFFLKIFTPTRDPSMVVKTTLPFDFITLSCGENILLKERERERKCPMGKRNSI
jgi:hypothetical protein